MFWGKYQTLLIKHSRLVYKNLFDRLATLQNIARQTFLLETSTSFFKNIALPILLVEQC